MASTPHLSIESSSSDKSSSDSDLTIPEVGGKSSKSDKSVVDSGFTSGESVVNIGEKPEGNCVRTMSENGEKVKKRPKCQFVISGLEKFFCW